jgi:hypothetical protein
MNRARLSPQVIRRRRIALLVVVALIGWGVWAGIAAIASLFPGAKPKVQAAACAAGVVSVTAYAGDGQKHMDVFDANTKPLIWFSIVNNGKVACTFNTGAAVQFFRIKSADQVIWTSEQCDRKGLKDDQTLLKPGVPQNSPAGQWMRVYSSGGGCGDGQAPALPGSYNLVAEVNKVVSGNLETFELQ